MTTLLDKRHPAFFYSLAPGAAMVLGINDMTYGNKQISAIVPCYNEARRIGKVLEALTQSGICDEIIVVDDGSSDKTKIVVKKYPIRYIKHGSNLGKGAALTTGVALARFDILLFCDADLSGLNTKIFRQMAEPVILGQADMFVAMRKRYMYSINKLLPKIPLFEGQRVLKRDLWDNMPDYYKRGYRIEVGLNAYARYYGQAVCCKIFPELSQTIKERKHGILKGLSRRLKMYTEILRTFVHFHVLDLPFNNRKTNAHRAERVLI